MIDTRYEIREGHWHTPGGHDCTFVYRDGTNDWNTLTASLDQDEYQLPTGLSGFALDIGGYLGSVGIALALDNPGLLVDIVEPVPENGDLIERNIAANGVGAWVTLIRGSVGIPTVRYGFSGTETMEHHAFVGNSSLFTDGPYHTVSYAPLTLRDLSWPDRVVLMKIDVEGAEWTFLDDPDVAFVHTIVGEAHAIDGHRGRDMADLLRDTHDVTFTGDPESTCGFRAVRR